ncbi:hypothetical protein [Xenorhabdus thuongxuanensis]|uniref:hypothetical protein n=1 Tax=Xenorhabdus thuongxuanensis TaxID=1873484 RepID=UPI00093FF97D
MAGVNHYLGRKRVTGVKIGMSICLVRAEMKCWKIDIACPLNSGQATQNTGIAFAVPIIS